MPRISRHNPPPFAFPKRPAYYMPPGAKRKETRKLVEQNGGTFLVSAPTCGTDDVYLLAKTTGDDLVNRRALHYTYIRDCLHEHKLLDKSAYRMPRYRSATPGGGGGGGAGAGPATDFHGARGST